MQVVLLTAH